MSETCVRVGPPPERFLPATARTIVAQRLAPWDVRPSTLRAVPLERSLQCHARRYAPSWRQPCCSHAQARPRWPSPRSRPARISATWPPKAKPPVEFTATKKRVRKLEFGSLHVTCSDGRPGTVNLPGTPAKRSYKLTPREVRVCGQGLRRRPRTRGHAGDRQAQGQQGHRNRTDGLQARPDRRTRWSATPAAQDGRRGLRRSWSSFPESAQARRGGACVGGSTPLGQITTSVPL